MHAAWQILLWFTGFGQGDETPPPPARVISFCDEELLAPAFATESLSSATLTNETLLAPTFSSEELLNGMCC